MVTWQSFALKKILQKFAKKIQRKSVEPKKGKINGDWSKLQ